MDDFDRHFDRHAAKVRNMVALTIIAKLIVFGALIGLAVYAINAFTG